MEEKLSLIVYYHKSNKYSFNALIGALETVDDFNDLDVFFISSSDELIEKVGDCLRKFSKVVVGFSFFTTQLWQIHDLITVLRKKYENKIILIAGGPHPTGDPQGTLKLGFDIVVRGEGEESFIELLQKIQRDEDYFKVKGISYLGPEGGYKHTRRRSFIELDKYPPFPIKRTKYGAIEISRGCPYACYFCQTPYLFGAKPRHRSIEGICKYVKVLKQLNKVDIRFITPNAFSYGSEDGKTLNLHELEELLIRIKEIIAPNGRIFLGSFPSEVRPEHVTRETLDLVLKYASNDNITIGAQSGSQRILDLCHRSHSVKAVYEAVNLTLEAKLRPNVDFIFGLPNETQEDIKLSLQVMEDLAQKGARIHAHSFIPLPQTPFEKEPVKKVSDDIKKTIISLTARGLAFGDWKKQEKLAIKIAKYLEFKKL